jgi:hypothetical protein
MKLGGAGVGKALISVSLRKRFLDRRRKYEKYFSRSVCAAAWHGPKHEK